jgi:hypothetical protein
MFLFMHWDTSDGIHESPRLGLPKRLRPVDISWKIKTNLGYLFARENRNVLAGALRRQSSERILHQPRHLGTLLFWYEYNSSASIRVLN